MNWYSFSFGAKNITDVFFETIPDNDYGEGGRKIYAYDSNANEIGYISYNIINNLIDINMIFVVPDYRRQGIGTKLVNELQRQNPGIGFMRQIWSPEGAELAKSLKQKGNFKETA